MATVESAPELAARLTRASRKQYWNPYTLFDWPEKLQADAWYMSPELISIYGTDVYNQLSEAQQKRLSLFELGNFFSLVLQGERPLVQGLVDQLHSKSTELPVTEYLHHFVDEENKHMVMFGEFCKRYVGKVYPEKKITIERKYAKGEEQVVFYCKTMVVEEIGDFYNVIMAKDDRVDPFVREINRVHHVDESRHLAFGRRHLKELFDKHVPNWSEDTLDSFRGWLADYLKSSWGDYYNPSMYRDAGLEDSYGVRQMALAHPVCADFRQRASAKLVDYFIDSGILEEKPAL
jgi:hypothetical protein